MIFRIDYWKLLRSWFLLNLAATGVTAGLVLYSEPHHRFAYADFAKAAGYINFAFLFSLVVDGPLLFIQVDQAAGVVKYQRLFRDIAPVVLEYSRVAGGLTTRSLSRNNPARVWALFYNGDE
ncbi:hypothetical protein [Hymenobacter convexus]|uniref:hypothetical protein n=1 Tax=Hymenobacter sp. CA1UV-4 TaxID=3063782 RepID=UPI002712F3A3|nr:hypothetical protein [Hymenobacter sp. CA1UV-4]MDO7852122.1 hypothetical protein [Hymenobacter sp. CA1UV-4]